MRRFRTETPGNHEEFHPLMTLTAPSPLDTPHGWPLAAWTADPDLEVRQLTHAVWPGHHVAFCGLLTSVTGSAWPTAGSPWLLPRMRCPRCAQAVDREVAQA